MKRLLLPAVLLTIGFPAFPVGAQILREAEAQLQSREYTRAAESLSGVLAGQPEKGYAEYLRAVAWLHGGKPEDAAKACDAVEADCRWFRKARLLKAGALTDLKRFEEAETIFAEEAARALSSARKDGLAGRLADFADEAAREPAPGETDAPPPNFSVAADLYRKALEVEFLTPDFTDATLFKLAVTLQKLGQPENALTVLNDYLIQFDKGWEPLDAAGADGRSVSQGARGELGPKPEKPRDAKRFLQPGKHVAEARLRLTQCQMSRPDWSAARKTVQDLVALQPQPDAATLAAAAWLRCQIIGGPGLYAAQFEAAGALLPPPAVPAQQVQTDQQAAFPPVDHAAHNAALREFLQTYAVDSHAPEAARLIGENLLVLGRTDEAVAAMTEFIDGKSYQFKPAPEADTRPDPATGLTPGDALARQKQESFFKIGQVQFDRKKFDPAITQWRAYTVNYPNGSQWAAAQQGIIDAEFQQGIAAVAAGEETLARERFDAFLTNYPLDGRARQILFIYGQFAYAAAQVQELADREKSADGALPAETVALFRSAMEQWSRLIAKYPQSEESSMALYNTALILTEKLDQPEQGLAAFRRLTWGQWAALAKQRAAILEEKSLAISAPRVFRTDETPHLALSVRNIKKVKVSRYPLDLEGWLRSAHRLGGLEKLDVDLIAPEKSWEVDVADFAPLRGLQQKIDIPFPENTAGACVVRVEGDDWQATTLVVRSDIELITEATRGELLVMAVDLRENKPAAGASVLVSDGESIIASGKTGDDGVYRFAKDGLPDTTRAFVLTSQGAMVSGLDLSNMTLVRQPETATHTTFDRTNYFPGQTAAFVILRRERKDNGVKPANGSVTLRILAPDNRLVLAQPATWAADGTVQGSFKIPRNAPAGEFKVQLLNAGGEVMVHAVFKVIETPAENTPQLSLKLDRTVVKPGGTIQAALLADWQWGLPVADEEVEITFADGHRGRLKTDDAGVLKFEVKSGLAGVEEWRSEAVTVRLPRQPESAGVTGNYSVTSRDWSLVVLPTSSVVPAGGAEMVRIRTLDAAGFPARITVRGKVVKLSAPPPSHVLEGVPWISYTAPPAAEETVEEFQVTTDPATGDGSYEFKPKAGGHYIVRFADGGIPRGNEAGPGADQNPAERWEQHGFYVSGSGDPHGLRLFADAATVDDGSTAKLRLQSLKARQRVLVTTSTDHFLKHELLTVPEGLTEIAVPVTDPHAPNFRVTAAAVDGRNLCAASVAFSVRTGLKVEMKPAEKPGEAPMVRVTDLAGNPVKASLLTAMIRTSPDPDAALSGWPASNPPRDFLSMEAPRELLDLRLAVHTSADLMFPGTSVRMREATGSASSSTVESFNDQQRLIEVQGLEYGLNSSNSILLTDNKIFSDMNCFVQVDAPRASRRGPLLFATGVKRAADSFVQAVNLPPVPDSANASGLDLSDNSGPVAGEDTRARLFTNARTAPAAPEPINAVEAVTDNSIDSLFPTSAAIGGNVSGTGSWNAPGDSGFWKVQSGMEGAFAGSGLEDGRWQSVVMAWTAESGLTTATLPMVRSRPLGLRVVRTEAGTAFLVVTNREGREGPVNVLGTGRTHCSGVVILDKTRLRQIFPQRTEISEGMTTVSMETGESAVLGTWTDRSQGWKKTPLKISGSARVASVGGVIREDNELALPMPGVGSEPMQYAVGRIFPTPTDLLTSLSEVPGDGAPDLLPESELLARVTLIQRLRKGSAGQKAKAESLVGICRELVSELALAEQGGGWPWGGLDISPDILATSQIWWALHEAKQAGITVSEKLQDRVRKFLTANYAGIPADDYDKKAAVLHAMAAAGLADYAYAAPLLRARENLSDTALAFLTAALVRMERPDEARQLLERLNTRAVKHLVGRTHEVAIWKGSDKIVRLSRPELTGSMVLWSMARLGDQFSPTGNAAVNALLSSHLLAGERGSLSRGAATVALDAWFTGPNDWTEPGYVQFLSASGPLNEAGDPLRVELPAGDGPNQFTVRPRDGKRVIFSIVLAGEPKETVDPKPWEHPEIASRKYYHDTVPHGDTPLKSQSTSPVKTAETGQRLRVEVKLKSTATNVAAHPQYLVWEEPIPACFALIPGSMEGNWDRVDILPDRIRLIYGPGVIQPLKYGIVALVPGESAVPPPVISDAYDPSKYRPGPAASLTVLPPGGKSPDIYEMNQAEHFELAGLTFADGNSAECLRHLDALAPSARKAEFEKDLARMRLWLLTDSADGDAAQIVQAFETLNERHPGLVIPFDRILRVGRAYQKIGEHERGAYIFSAALDANFLTDSGISAVLEDQGDFAGSVDFQESLWFDAPDSGDPRAALFALSQSLFQKSGNAENLPVRRGQKKQEKNGLLTRSRDLLTRFITLYPAEALADDAAFSLTNACFALKDYAGVVAAAEAGARRHPASPFLGQFQYMAALGHFWQFHYQEALASAAPVADGGSKDRDLARYITGQIYHAEGKPAEAVEWYGKVRDKYADAADSLAAFERKKIGVPEIATFTPSAEVKVEVTHRNVKEASLQIYKVDLMKLYLREKNLSRVTSVNLAGIGPEAAVPVDIANASPWTDHQLDVTLPLKDEGAYLIIARADDLFTSGLVLITALKLDVREDAASGAVRVNVLGATDGKYVADAEVKAIASDSTAIQSGQTDPRGIFEASGLSGLATVIVRQGENRFAFHRGTVSLGGGSFFPRTPTTPQSMRNPEGLEFDPPQIPQHFGGKVLSKDAYLENVDFDNGQIIDLNTKTWDAKRRASGKGVQADKAMKK